MKFQKRFLISGFSILLTAGLCLANLNFDIENITKLNEAGNTAFEQFIRESFDVRIRYEFNGKFANQNDKDILLELSKKADMELHAVEEKQKFIKQKIEDYTDDDWNAKFGSTGLWQKVSAQCYNTSLNLCRVNFYLALSSNQQEQKEILQNILSEIEVLTKTHDLAYLQLLKAKSLALLAESDWTYNLPAKEAFNSLIVRTDMELSTVFKMTIEQLKFEGSASPGELDKLAEELFQSGCKNNLEIALSVACLQHRYSPQNIERIIQLYPQIKNYFTELILSQLLQPEQDLQELAVFEAELAAQAIWKNNLTNYHQELCTLCDIEKFQTPLITYVLAVSLSKSQTDKAIELLIRASTLQKKQKSEMLPIEAEKIAKQAVQLAQNLFIQNPSECPLAIKAFENYQIIANEHIDDDIEYSYIHILEKCGDSEKAGLVLQKIANNPAAKYRNKARVELAAQAVRKKLYETANQKMQLINQFADAVENEKNCMYCSEITELLKVTIEKIEEIESQIKNYAEFLQNCGKVAELCSDFTDEHSKLITIETIILAYDKDSEKFLNAEKTLAEKYETQNDNANLVRCMARIAEKKGNYEKAASLWAEICVMRKNDTANINQRSWEWWRAKCYELDCWLKCPNTSKKNVAHTIDILENTFANIETPWSEKLRLLKQKCGN